jgi:hydroxymethylbilane synthase
MSLLNKSIAVGARDSALSKAQVEEVLQLMQEHFPNITFLNIWFKTKGDVDLKTPLSSMGATDFFTKEIDEAVLSGVCEVAIHSAKDLPDPIPDALEVIAYTKGVDSSDVLVFRDQESLETLSYGAKIGTSSLRREKNIKALRSDLQCVEIRGPVDKRLELLDGGEFDAVSMAKAALIRLKLTRSVADLPGESAFMQGRLAIVARKDNQEMKALFSCLHSE